MTGFISLACASLHQNNDKHPHLKGLSRCRGIKKKSREWTRIEEGNEDGQDREAKKLYEKGWWRFWENKSQQTSKNSSWLSDRKGHACKAFLIHLYLTFKPLSQSTLNTQYILYSWRQSYIHRLIFRKLNRTYQCALQTILN